MFTLLLILTVTFLAFTAGFFVGIKNANSRKVEKSIDLLKALKSKD